MSKMELAASIRQQSQKMAEKPIKEQMESQEKEINYCTICYCNELDPENRDTTVVFDCGHRFCSECTLG